MSYDIYIGNAELESEWPGEDGARAEWTVNLRSEAEAPFKPDMTGRGNSCHPGYSQWANAMRDVGLYDAFFGKEEGLLREHPGIQPLTTGHLATFESARTAYMRSHPAERAGMCPCHECQVFGKDTSSPHDPTLNFNMLRLDWLCWWTKWALEHCERPAMSNR